MQLLRYILHTCQTCDVTPVQSAREWIASVHTAHMTSALEWTASVHTAHMTKPVM